MAEVLVTGAKGLLGSHLCVLYPDFKGVDRQELDITNPTLIDKCIKTYKPAVIINCAGIVPKAQTTPYETYRVNAVGPRLLREFCTYYGIKLIQISTDCVFSGNRRARYLPDDLPNSLDDYGQSKALGELEYPFLTIRTSFIGYPDSKSRGLMSWFINNPETEIKGYSNVLWNGLTTVQLARELALAADKVLTSDFGGVVHLGNKNTISKCELLQIINDVYDLKKTIVPSELPILNRTLAGKLIDIPYAQGIEELRSLEAKLSCNQ